MTLLFHDGELTDVRTLLEELGTGFVERRGVLLPEDRERDFALVIATPQRMLGLALGADRERPTQIAICDSDTRSLRNSLRRAGIQLMVRRPVHPAALRAIVLHSLYRGPERRRSVRVSIGAPVRYRSGWRQRSAVLADLSVGGFRLLTDRPVDAGRSLTLHLPVEVSGDKALSVKGRVLRCARNADGTQTITAKLEKLRPKQLAAIKGVLKAHASGPATFDREDPLAAADASPEPAPPIAAPRAEAPHVAAAPQAPPAERCAAPARSAMDERGVPLGDQASRVLMGRDLSLGGMRVDPNPLLTLGDDLRLAIHVQSQDVPLVVTARVHRIDADRGAVLRFHEMDREAAQLLDAMLDALPIFEPGAPKASPGMLVSEILTAESGAPPASGG